METSVREQREQFVEEYAGGRWTMTALCARFGISRPTGYKWWARYVAEGTEGLTERSRRPAHCPHQTAARLEERIIAARREYGWGAKKLRYVLAQRAPQTGWPARSTINDILDRHGLLQKRRRRARWPSPPSSALQTTRPNQIWPADFKGQFKLGTGQYCYPLTITDHFSRQVLACAGLRHPNTRETRQVFARLFHEVGLPEAIRTDNGQPFCSTGLQGLSALSVWWMQLGIVHQRIRPARPQDNGTHERMHRELKRETARPAAATARAQQQRFNAFRRRYNEERPHEALGQQPPASKWVASPRPYPRRLRPPDYPAHLEVRRVCGAGTITFQARAIYLTQALRGQAVALEEIDEGLWTVQYYQTVLGTLDEPTGTITSATPLITV